MATDSKLPERRLLHSVAVRALERDRRTIKHPKRAFL
jgi:hypothetical protein